MKDLLNWQTKEVVNIYDELPLWSAPFGKVLLENIPMKKGACVLDIGFGTGFPLVELSQRFGADAVIYGVDVWDAAISRAKEKINVLGINNIKILQQSATKIDIDSSTVDLVTSNLGINNFEHKQQVYAEIRRVLKDDGSLCITTNTIGTFDELYRLMLSVSKELGLEEAYSSIERAVNNRGTKQEVIEEFKDAGLIPSVILEDPSFMRFASADALFDHGIIRIGFRAHWESLIAEQHRETFFKELTKKIESVIAANGAFKMSIPVLYMELKKAEQ